MLIALNQGYVPDSHVVLDSNLRLAFVSLTTCTGIHVHVTIALISTE